MKGSTAGTPDMQATEVPRRWRRMMVVAMYAVYPLAVVLHGWAGEALAPRLGAGWWLVAQFAGFMALLMTLSVAWFVNMSATRSIAEQRPSQLDEREAGVRGRAYRPAFNVMALVLLGALLYLTVLRDLGVLRDAHIQHVFWGALLLYLTLPTSIIAWTEPDLPADDADLGYAR